MSYLVFRTQMHNNPAYLNRFTHAAVWEISVTIDVIAVHVHGGGGGLDDVTTSLNREGSAHLTIPRTDWSATTS